MPRALTGTVNGRGGNSSQNGFHGDLPPSTIVQAQLVNKLHKPSGHFRQDEAATFRQLLKEVLDTNNEPASSLVDSFDILSTNYKLIFVIVKVGLDPLLREVTPVIQNELVRQALDCLKAIYQTIQRTPSILFNEPTASDSISSTDVPMFTWLVPKLLLIACISQDDDLVEACKSCIVHLLCIDRQATIRHARPNALRQFMKLYIQGASLQINLTARLLT